MRLVTTIVTGLAFLATLVLPYAARAQQPAPAGGDETLQQAKAHFEAGKNAYNAGDYQGAIREFKAAEALRPSPILDYNIGLANEKLQKRRVAVKYYRRYLEGMPSAPNRAQVEASIQQLEREIAAQPQQPPGTEQPADMPPQQAPPPAQPTYGSYDPYGSGGQQPPPVVQQPQPVKKKSYWWVALIVVAGVAILAGVVAYAIIVSRPSTVRSTFLTNDPAGDSVRLILERLDRLRGTRRRR